MLSDVGHSCLQVLVNFNISLRASPIFADLCQFDSANDRQQKLNPTPACVSLFASANEFHPNPTGSNADGKHTARVKADKFAN